MNTSRQQLTLEGKVENLSLFKDASGTEITEQELEDKVHATLHEMSSWELIDLIETYIPMWELEILAQDEEGNWYE